MRGGLEPRPSVERNRLAVHHRLSELLDESLAHVKNFYFGVSAAFLNPDAPSASWMWVRDREENISGVTARWSLETSPHRVHRLLPVLNPLDIVNPYERSAWQTALKTFCHFHLRDGAVLYVAFLPPGFDAVDDLLDRLNLAYFSDGSCFSLRGFWGDRFEAEREVGVGSDAKHFISETISHLPMSDLPVVQLWYDPRTFRNERRPNDALNRANRRFIHALCGGLCQGPRGFDRCQQKTDLRRGQLDHIIPIGSGSGVLLNETWLCGPCNRAKGSMLGTDFPIEKSLRSVPESLVTRSLANEISLDPPPWIQNYRGRPPNVLRHFL